MRIRFIMAYLIPHFKSFVIMDLFDDPFPKHVWDDITIVQELCQRYLSMYSAKKQGDYYSTTKNKVNFPADVWKYLSVFQFDGHARWQLIKTTARGLNGIVAKSIHDI